MPDTKNHDTKNQKDKKVDPRASRREARARRLRLVTEGQRSTVKVFAANETFREVLRHANGARFGDGLVGPVSGPAFDGSGVG